MAVCDIPDYEFENLARSFLPAMQKYFANTVLSNSYEIKKNRLCRLLIFIYYIITLFNSLKNIILQNLNYEKE